MHLNRQAVGVTVLLPSSVLWAVGIFVALKAPSVASGAACLSLQASCPSSPSAILFTGSHVAGTLEKGGEYAGAAAAGAAIGGGLVSGFMGILGFFLGAVFLVIGLSFWEAVEGRQMGKSFTCRLLRPAKADKVGGHDANSLFCRGKRSGH